MTYLASELQHVDPAILAMRKARRKAKLTQTQVAVAICVGVSNYGRAEVGRTKLPARKIREALAYIERVGVDDLSQRVAAFRRRWTPKIPMVEAAAMAGISARSWQAIEYRTGTTRRCKHRERVLAMIERWERSSERPNVSVAKQRRAA